MLKESFPYLSWWLTVKVVLLSLYLSEAGKLIYNNTWMHWIRKDSFRAVTCFPSYSALSAEICQTGCRRDVCTWKGSPARSLPLPSLSHLSFCPSDCEHRAALPIRGWRRRGEGLASWLKRTQELVRWNPSSWIELSSSLWWHRQLSLLCSLAIEDLIQISPQSCYKRLQTFWN